jgi:large subunit ribosomal protein L4
MKAAALRSALSARAADGKVVVIDGLTFDPPKTKEAVATLRACGIEGKVLIVLVQEEAIVAFAFRNIPGVHIIVSHQLNTYDVLDAGTVLFTTRALEAFQAPATAQPVESDETS